MAVEVGSYVGDDDGNRISVVASADAVTVNDGENEVVLPKAMRAAVGLLLLKDCTQDEVRKASAALGLDLRGMLGLGQLEHSLETAGIRQLAIEGLASNLPHIAGHGFEFPSQPATVIVDSIWWPEMYVVVIDGKRFIPDPRDVSRG